MHLQSEPSIASYYTRGTSVYMSVQRQLIGDPNFDRRNSMVEELIIQGQDPCW